MKGLRLHGKDDVIRALRASHGRPLVIFKHSRTCPVSARALREWESFSLSPQGSSALLAYLVVQEDRQASVIVAEELGVRHESPQAILVVGGRAVWHASHQAVTREALRDALERWGNDVPQSGGYGA